LLGLRRFRRRFFCGHLICLRAGLPRVGPRSSPNNSLDSSGRSFAKEGRDYTDRA
jgi:hypothetical protein